jgi:hypothetical protein
MDVSNGKLSESHATKVADFWGKEQDAYRVILPFTRLRLDPYVRVPVLQLR